MIKRKRKPSYRPIREGSDDLVDRVNEMLRDGFSLDNDVNGEIIVVTLAPNESKIISHGLRIIPKYRMILRQTGNAVITDVDASWTDKTIGLLNNSAVTVVLTIKIF